MLEPGLKYFLKDFATNLGCSLPSVHRKIEHDFGMSICELRETQLKQMIVRDWGNMTCREMSLEYKISERYLLTIRHKLGRRYICRHGGNRRSWHSKRGW